MLRNDEKTAVGLIVDYVGLTFDFFELSKLQYSVFIFFVLVIVIVNEHFAGTE